MTSERVRVLPVDMDGISTTLDPTHKLRLALSVLLGELPPDMDSDSVNDALQSLSDALTRKELQALRDDGHSKYYLIIQPINLVKPPPPEIMAKIGAAVSTLAELGMLAMHNDDLYQAGDELCLAGNEESKDQNHVDPTRRR